MQVRVIAALLGLTACLAGCGPRGPEHGYVTGKVRLNGETVHGATVTFVPQGSSAGSTASGATDENGEYELYYTFNKKGAPLGTYDVTIEKRVYSASEIEELKQAGKPYGDQKRIPVRFSEPGELSAEVKSGHQQIDFDIDL